MRSANCQKAIDTVIYLEDKTGYGWVTTDTGGTTRWGISSRAFPGLNIASLTREEAAQLYEDRYWKPAHGDLLPWPLALFVFDAAVNQGPTAAAVMLQRVAGVKEDGIIGPQTIAAVQSIKAIAHEYLTERARRYASTAGYDTYGRGWFNRLFELALLA